MAQQQSDYRFTFSSAAGEFDVISFDVREALSEAFHLRLNLSRMNEDPVSFSDALDNPGTLKFWKGPEPVRYLNGIVSFFHQRQSGTRRTQYTAVIEPIFARTDLTSTLRVFQEISVPDIIRQVLKENGVNPVRFDLGDHEIREYCIQYRETVKAFIERLAAEEGIFYYFEHSETDHTLVFCDDVQKLPSLGKVLHNPNISASRTEPSLWHFNYQEQIATARHKMRDRYFKNPDYDLEHKKAGLNLDNQHAHYEKYDYPGRYKFDASGKPFNQYRLEFERRDTRIATATSDDLKLITGKYLTLSQAPTANEQTVWLAVSVSHAGTQPQSQKEDSASGGGSYYDSTLELIPQGQPWRAEQQPKPRVDGPQIATITGPPGEEIYCDEYARVKLQFPWDLEGQYDENSSCWIRVSQYWAGTKWGGMAIPRIGQEVIVSFLEGDPDQPIVTGRTYNANNMPHYPLPAEKTKMSIKSKTHKGEGFNELRFEDEAGKEQIFIHAQMDQDVRVLNDAREWIGNERHLIVKKDQFEEVEGNKHSNTKEDRFEQVEGDQHLTVKGDQNDKITGSTSRNISMDLQEKIGMKHAVDAGTEIHLKAGMNAVIEAEVSITLKSGSSFINLNPAGVFIEGEVVLINSGGAAVSGTGCNPNNATAPTAAIEADDAIPGKDALPPPPVTVVEPLAIDPDKTICLTDAAHNASAFVRA